MTTMRLHEHDIVELRRDIDGWPAGTVGAIVSVYPHSALVEVSDPDDERDLLEELVSVPADALSVISTASAAVVGQQRYGVGR